LSAYESFRSRDFRLFLAASLLSNFGMRMLSVAVSWDLYLETKSALVLGNVGFVQVTPFLVFALLAGHFADRLDRRRIMMWTQAVVIAASAVLLTHTRSVARIYGVLLLTASARDDQTPTHYPQ
jgi:MFS family permease